MQRITQTILLFVDVTSMNTNYGLNTYRSNDLNIAMKTSSGDLIKMDFSSVQSASLNYSKNKNNTLTSLNFSSQQSFQFSIKGNGISLQDQKEIDAFMKTAQPFIDKFITKLQQDAPASPVTKVATQIASLFNPSRPRNEDEKNGVKTNIVKMFDKNFNRGLQHGTNLDKVFKEMQNLLKKTLQEFDKLEKAIYA